MVTVLPALILKTRKSDAAALSRCTVSVFAPDPEIVRFLPIVNSPEVRLIVCGPAGRLKVIVAPSQASTIAWRKLPAPLSLVLVTTGAFRQIVTVVISEV